MHKKYIALLCLLAGVTFFNCLINGFVGDDEFLFIKNPYFHTWANLPKIFTKEYIADQDAVFNDVAEHMNSGSVGYRPVLSITYFLDHWLWGSKAFGYHLQNVLIHLINTVLVYFMFFAILKDPLNAFVGAMIFSLHPLRSEAVASVGYRADSLAAMFLLLAFLSYVKAKRVFAHLFFFLALFSKESAVVFPGLVMAYDWLVQNKKVTQVLKDLFSKYIGFILILSFYLFVYIKIFPNSSLGGVAKPLAAGGSVQALTILYIFSHYLTVFLFPFLVKSLPPLYTPVLGPLFGLRTGLAVLIVIGFIWILFKARHQKNVLFFLFWFLLCFIPVSNIIVIVNPMAYRFMYLPSVGLAGAAGILLIRLRDRFGVFQRNSRLFPVLITGLIGLCMSATIFLNFSWKDNAMMSIAMVKDFPDYPVGYLHAAMSYYDAGLIDESKKLLQQGIEKGLVDPRAYYLMGVCTLSEPAVSRAYFERSIDIFPKFLYSYIGLGRNYLLENDLEKALAYLYASLDISPRWNSFGYLIQAHWLRNEKAKAKEVFERSQRELDPVRAQWLAKLYNSLEKNEAKIPMDLGI